MSMTRMILAGALALGLTEPALAGAEDDIKAVLHKVAPAYNACDVATLQRVNHTDFFKLNPDGTVTEGNSMADMKAACDAGTKYDVKLEVAKVHVRGDWAIVIGYTTGSIVPKGGEAQQVDNHFTVVMVMDAGSWRVLHLQSSRNVKPPAQ